MKPKDHLEHNRVKYSQTQLVKYSQTQLVSYKLCLTVLYPYYDLYNTMRMSHLEDHSEDLCEDKAILDHYINTYDLLLL